MIDDSDPFAGGVVSTIRPDEPVFWFPPEEFDEPEDPRTLRGVPR